MEEPDLAGRRWTSTSSARSQSRRNHRGRVKSHERITAARVWCLGFGPSGTGGGYLCYAASGFGKRNGFRLRLGPTCQSVGLDPKRRRWGRTRVAKQWHPMTGTWTAHVETFHWVACVACTLVYVYRPNMSTLDGRPQHHASALG
jgi:hypothetical protein